MSHEIDRIIAEAIGAPFDYCDKTIGRVPISKLTEDSGCSLWEEEGAAACEDCPFQVRAPAYSTRDADALEVIKVLARQGVCFEIYYSIGGKAQLKQVTPTEGKWLGIFDSLAAALTDAVVEGVHKGGPEALVYYRLKPALKMILEAAMLKTELTEAKHTISGLDEMLCEARQEIADKDKHIEEPGEKPKEMQ